MRALVALAALALAACGQPQSTAYPPQYEANFMQGCTGTGALTSQCGCVWQKIVTEIPVREFEAYDRVTPAERETHPVTTQLRGFITACQASTGAAGPSGAQPVAPAQ